MATFQDYLNYENNNGEYSEKQLKIMNRITLSDETINKIKSINKTIDILAVAQVYCPDCRAIVPFIEKFAELNKNIKVTYLNRDEAGELLQAKTGAVRIPTLFHSNGTDLDVFLLEFTKFVHDRMTEDSENYDNIKYEFRTGKFNAEIEKELVEKFLSF